MEERLERRLEPPLEPAITASVHSAHVALLDWYEPCSTAFILLEREAVRRRIIGIWLLLASMVAPVAAYECLQKAHEATGLPLSALLLSAEAEGITPWRGVTGKPWLDRPLHELAETRAFYSLALERLQ